jgi:hypothetical protein
MINGNIKIVIEPVQAGNSSWVPAEIAGDGMSKWKHHVFEIDR